MDPCPSTPALCASLEWSEGSESKEASLGLHSATTPAKPNTGTPTTLALIIHDEGSSSSMHVTGEVSRVGMCCFKLGAGWQ